MPDAPDMTDRYNTGLTAAEDLQFGDWAARQRSLTQRDPTKDMFDYDMQGWWKKNNGKNLADVEDLGDEFKKPNHPTFSDESKYHGVDGHFGGTWKGNQFSPGAANMQFHGEQKLREHFKQVEEPAGNMLAPLPQYDEEQASPGHTLQVTRMGELSGVAPSQNIEERRGRMNMLTHAIINEQATYAHPLGAASRATAPARAQSSMQRALASNQDIQRLGDIGAFRSQLRQLGMRRLEDEKTAAWKKWVETGEGEPPWAQMR